MSVKRVDNKDVRKEEQHEQLDVKNGILKQFIPYLAVIIAMLIWAGAGIAVKEALLVFTPMTLIVLRFSIAVVLMFVIGMLFKRNNLLGLNRLKV
jgi:drug/metabolite transporter (DMT)-like permease